MSASHSRPQPTFGFSLSTPSHQEESTWTTFAKRCHPQQLQNVPNSDSDDDICHREKRRRHNNSLTMDNVEDCLEPLPWPQQSESTLKINHVSQFPSTSSEFSLFPSSSPPRDNVRRSPSSESIGYHEGQDEYPSDLARLRTSAFWELRQSVAENGEGLVRRMRDYERSRSRHQTHQKAKEAEKRGRKRFPRRQKTSVNASDDSDEDNILISSGDASNGIKWDSFLHKRSRSLNVMDVDGQEDAWSPIHHTRSQSTGPSSDIHYTSGTENSQSDGEDSASLEDAMYRHDSFTDPMLEPAPALSHSSFESANSSLLSLALPPSIIETDSALPSTASEKALAALNLALANGAGSITDYSSIWKYQEQFNLGEGHDHGELWK